MRQIYDFEAVNPPVLTEFMLQEALERKKLERQTAAVALAGLLMQICILLFGIVCYQTSPILAWMAVGYCIVSFSGGGVIALVFQMYASQVTGKEASDL